MPSCTTFCSYPNGYIPLAPGLISIVAFILSSISLFSCHYAGTDVGARSDVGVGLFFREVTDDESFWLMAPTDSERCAYYGQYSVKNFVDNRGWDMKFKAAQGLGLTAWICGFIVLVAVWALGPCFAAPKNWWTIGGFSFLMVGTCQLFTLLILPSNLCSLGCSLKTAGVVGIVASIFWFIAGGICFMVPEPRDDERSAPHQPVSATKSANPVQMEMPAAGMTSETTSHRVEADGRTVRETIKTNPDGTTTVTTVVLPPPPGDATVEKV